MNETRICPICGESFEARTSPSRAGRGIYCSIKCRGGHNRLSHGHTVGGNQSPTYATWVNMVRRCTDPGHDKFCNYGAKGITVCARWLDFGNFLADMGERPENCTIDRKDGAAGYTPENCRWVSIKAQQRNLKSNVFIEFKGERKCISEWAELYGLDKTLLAWRIRKGWTTEEALLTKPRRGNRIKNGLHTLPFPPSVF